MRLEKRDGAVEVIATALRRGGRRASIRKPRCEASELQQHLRQAKKAMTMPRP
jgi:hypothetical protein